MTRQGSGEWRRQPYGAWILWVSILVLASVPALASDQDQPPQNPFAVYNAQLNDAASRTLDRVVQPEPAATEHAPRREERTVSAPLPGRHRAWQRVARLRPVLEPILREVGVPTELAAVVLVESGGDRMALSPKGARGLWQLMPDTARRYGLVVDSERDERLDVSRSTRAAAEYLRDLYAEFHDWQLVLAGYNAGEQAVQHAVARTGNSAFSVAGRALPMETQNYVPAVLNALPHFGITLRPKPTSYTRLQGVVIYAEAEQ
jgi:soluble lytic murein transglycosylase-like protein